MAQGQSPVGRLMRARLALLWCAVAVSSVIPSGVVAAMREAMLPVARVTVYPGTVITADMLAIKIFRGKDLDITGFAASADTLIGKVARKTLLPNAPIATAGVRDPFTVTQGQPAVVVFQSGGLVISAFAVSLQNGSAGEVISLRNTESGTTIRGVVQADGTVRVGQP